jgi:integrase
VVKTTKTDAGTRTLLLPRWCVGMLRARAARLDRTEVPVIIRSFPPSGQLSRSLQHPGRPAGCLDRRGFDWVISHVFRKTVATLMDQPGRSSTAAADQLGHANTSMTTDVYFGRKVATTGAAAVLEALDT